MIGIGLDIIEIDRVRAVLERWSERFVNRILRPDELTNLRASSDPASSIAARFAGKEAVGKAFGTGIGDKLRWHDIEIFNDPSGQPHVRLHGPAKNLLHEIGGKHVHVSLTHSRDQAAAVVVVEG